jgi:hypothetical protein
MSLRATVRKIQDCNYDQITVQVEYTIQIGGIDIIQNLTLTKEDYYLWRENAPAANNTMMDYATYMIREAYGKLQVMASAGTSLTGKAFAW